MTNVPRFVIGIGNMWTGMDGQNIKFFLDVNNERSQTQSSDFLHSNKFRHFKRIRFLTSGHYFIKNKVTFCCWLSSHFYFKIYICSCKMFLIFCTSSFLTVSGTKFLKKNISKHLTFSIVSFGELASSQWSEYLPGLRCYGLYNFINIYVTAFFLHDFPTKQSNLNIPSAFSEP